MTYRDDPAGFVRDCFIWPDGKGPTDYQTEAMDALVRDKRITARAPHGAGKTASNAWLVLWFALTRDAEGSDWKIATTASAWRQLTHFLWPEIKKWARIVDWERVGRKPFSRFELQQLGLKLPTGEAFAVASTEPAKIEGVHADELLYIFDEAKTIPGETFDAAEGAFSGAGEDTEANAYAVASSTPGAPTGRFYEICSRKTGLEAWHPRHVTKENLIRAHRMDAEWAAEKAKQWGERSAVYRNRVLGEFAASEEDGVIPLAWVELAVERWRVLRDAGELESEPLEAVGVDVAEGGPDKTVFALRRAQTISELRKYSRQGTMETAGRVVGILNETSAKAIVDVAGIGSGVVGRCKEQDANVYGFNASHKTSKMDKARELGFINTRAAAWWNLREILDPDSGNEVALPDDDTLLGDLTAPKWWVASGGKVQIEAKKDIKKRIGRSTDDGDAVVQAFWEPSRVTQGSGFGDWNPGPSRWAVS